MPRLRGLALAVTTTLTTLLVGCASAPVKPAPAPGVTDLAGAVQQIATDLAQQIGSVASGKTAVIDPVLERTTGQQTVLSAELESLLGPSLTTSIKGLKLLVFDAVSATDARYVVTATVVAADSASQYTVNASVTDRPTGLVVGQSAARFVKKDADLSPTSFYNESPTLVRDRSVEGYVRTSETKKGSAADALYVSQIPTAGLLAQALTAYNDGRWQHALDAYDAAAARADGQQLRTFSGVYRSNIRLNRVGPATEAFGKLAALGIATNNLDIKLLFKPGSSTEFWPTREVSGMYPMWLKQIAKAAEASGSCLNIIGHTSRSGSETVNARLSVARAETVRRTMIAESARLSSRLRASGVGSSENWVGSGADDASDAVDRRVGFKVEPCKN